MAEPHVALDAKALEAAESAYAKATMDLPRHECENCGGSGVIITGRARGEHADANTCQACGGGGVVVDFPEGWNPMASAITAYLAALSQNPGTSNTSGEAVGAQKLLGSDDDPESLAYALRIGAMGTPFNDYQGALYMNSRYKADEYRDAEFRDYGLARAVRIILNNADAIRNILAALEPRASDRERTIEECAKVAHKAHLTYAQLRDTHRHDTLDWERADASTKAAAAIWHAIGDLLPREPAAAIRKLSEVSHEH